MTIRRKNSAKFSKAKLLNDYNDIDIYIEDTAKNYDKLYINIFQRVFDECKIENVFPIGSRGNVINICKEKQNSVTRPSLFIVDGDLYLLKGECELPKGVFRLPYYCIENVLLDPAAIIEFLNEEHASLRKEEIEAKFSYDNWKKVCSEPLAKLFLRYAAIQKLNIQGVSNVSIPVQEFIDEQNGYYIDCKKVDTKLSELDEVIHKSIHPDELIDMFNGMEALMDQSFCKLNAHVSGKDYLYPLLYNKASSILGKSISHLNFKQRLALKCDLSQIIDCKEKLLEPLAPE